MSHSIWSGFYKKPLKERLTQLKLEFPSLFPHNLTLTDDIADNMIENCIGTIALPLGLGLNFTINSITLVVPMTIEEPSVIAAVSGAAKTISEFGLDGGFVSSTSSTLIYSQIQILDISDSRIDNVIQKVLYI
jgi:degradative hydroxymethylglutaryl-CoA reductase